MGGIILALAAALALTACSAVKLGYNSLPNLAYWWLDGYVAFSDEQAPQVQDQLARFVGWHRREELPRVAELLARMEQMAPGDITPQQACGIVAEAQARLAAAADYSAGPVAQLAAGFSPRQLRHLERKYRSNNESFFKEWLAPAPPEQVEKRFRQMLERLEMVYGRLDEPQRAVLRQAIAESRYEASRILAERQRRQRDLLQVLRRIHHPGVAPAEARTLVRGYFERVQQSPDPAFRSWQEGLLQEGCRTFAAVHGSTTTAQREQAVRRLRAYQRDLRELIAGSP